jgi:bacillithiol synthase
MPFTTDRISYTDTASFSTLVTDYIAQENNLSSFIENFPSQKNIEAQIKKKATYTFDRKNLVKSINANYNGINVNPAVQSNIDLLLQENTFTICTAHQPNIFTGHLYFIYKILHTVKLATDLKKLYAAYNFVPVFYMGSEDADLDELGHINIDGEKWEWQTKQKGAVGRMVIDKAFVQLIEKIKGRFGNEVFGNEIIEAIDSCYSIGNTIQQATLAFVHFLFGKYGVVTLIADDVILKARMIPIFKNEIENETSHQAAENTTNKLAAFYKGQAHSRPINLFYLQNDIRERIEKDASGNYFVVNTDIVFTKQALLQEIETNPQHFSPNVILRGLYQETILPNIIFVGGGGEIAYWLQLKEVFKSYKTLFPILIVRNSFLIQTAKQQKQWQQLGFGLEQLFKSIVHLENIYTTKNTTNELSLANELIALEKVYKNLQQKATAIDKSLLTHIGALQKKHLKNIAIAEKKFLKAEKRNFAERLLHIQKIKNNLFPNQSLQERYDNIIPYYAKYRSAIFDIILEASLSIEQQFTVVTVT